MSAFTTITPSLLADLTRIVSDANISAGASDRQLHSHDQSFHNPHLPDVVVWPTSAEQVAEVLRFANTHHIPVTPWGTGSSLEGNPIPLHGGISLSLARMDAVVAIHADDFQVTVQPGKPYKTLNQELKPYGLFFPPDPGANATVGGMLANNAAGIRTVKYGASKENVLALQIALADGRLIRVGSRSIKQSAGYNLTQLIVGSEGTLGVITEATLKLAPVPEYRTTMIASFPTVEDAVEAVVAVRGSGIDVAALEFLDTPVSQTLAARGMAITPNPTLLMEVHNAHNEAMEADIVTVRDLCVTDDEVSFVALTDPTQQAAIWQARHEAYETLVQTFPDMSFQIMDVAVPISAYPAIIAYAREQLAANSMMGFLVGHAGDGNIHITLPYSGDEGLQKVKAINAAIVKKALQLDGTATGEHGVGMGKIAYMADEHGSAMRVMQQIKQVLDPNGIMNPGKVLP